MRWLTVLPVVLLGKLTIRHMTRFVSSELALRKASQRRPNSGRGEGDQWVVWHPRAAESGSIGSNAQIISKVRNKPECCSFMFHDRGNCKGNARKQRKTALASQIERRTTSFMTGCSGLLDIRSRTLPPSCRRWSACRRTSYCWWPWIRSGAKRY